MKTKKIDNFSKIQARYFDFQAEEDLTEFDSNAAKLELKEVISFLRLAPRSKILEVGCGTGRYSLKFLSLGFDVIGVDISTKSLEKLEKKYKSYKSLGWGKLKINQRIPPKEKCNACVFINILHHVENPEKLIIQAKRCLKPKGVVFLFEPNPLCLCWFFLFAVRGILRLERGILHCHVWGLKKLLERTGFKNVEYQPYGLLPTRFLSRFPRLLELSTIRFSKLPFLRLFSFHNMLRGELADV